MSGFNGLIHHIPSTSTVNGHRVCDINDEVLFHMCTSTITFCANESAGNNGDRAIFPQSTPCAEEPHFEQCEKMM